MARPSNEIQGTGPIQDFARWLREIRAAAGTPTYQAMARRGLSSPAVLSQAASGKVLPTREAVQAFCLGLGHDPDSLTYRRIEDRRRQIHDAVSRPSVRQVTPVRVPEHLVNDPRDAATLDELAYALDRLRVAHNLSERAVATLTGLTRHEVDTSLTGRKQLTPAFVALVIKACGIDDGEARVWIGHCAKLEVETVRAAAALNALSAPWAVLRGPEIVVRGGIWARIPPRAGRSVSRGTIIDLGGEHVIVSPEASETATTRPGANMGRGAHRAAPAKQAVRNILGRWFSRNHTA